MFNLERLMMRVDPMTLTVCCGLASSTYVIATALGQLAFPDISASLSIPTPAFIALLSLSLFALAAARRRVWDNSLAATWSARNVTADYLRQDTIIASSHCK